eukprot:1139334-Pelagomonas_calceolata.AAC.10
MAARPLAVPCISYCVPSFGRPNISHLLLICRTCCIQGLKLTSLVSEHMHWVDIHPCLTWGRFTGLVLKRCVTISFRTWRGREQATKWTSANAATWKSWLEMVSISFRTTYSMSRTPGVLQEVVQAGAQYM